MEQQPQEAPVDGDPRLDFKMNKIPVVYYEESLEDDIFDACRQSIHIGLTHIRLGQKRNVLICLTTEEAIFVMSMKHEAHVEIICKLLMNQHGIKFYTTRGKQTTFLLQSEFGIKVDDKQFIDLPAYEIFLSMRKCCLNGSLSGNDYRMSTLSKNEDMIRHHNREDLTRLYLGVTLPERDTEKERIETNLIREYPESDAAKDIIRKRSCLLDDLAIKIEEAHEAMTFQDVKNLYSFAHRVTGDKYTEYENLDDDSYAKVIEYLKR